MIGDLAEVMIRTEDGEKQYFFGLPVRGETGYETKIIKLWEKDELKYIDRSVARPIAFYMPVCDIQAYMMGGYLCFKRNGQALSMIARNQILEIVSGIGDCMVDFDKVK